MSACCQDISILNRMTTMRHPKNRTSRGRKDIQCPVVITKLRRTACRSFYFPRLFGFVSHSKAPSGLSLERLVFFHSRMVTCLCLPVLESKNAAKQSNANKRSPPPWLPFCITVDYTVLTGLYCTLHVCRSGGSFWTSLKQLLNLFETAFVLYSIYSSTSLFLFSSILKNAEKCS